jgi:hypothetical protein
VTFIVTRPGIWVTVCLLLVGCKNIGFGGSTCVRWSRLLMFVGFYGFH